MPNKRLPMFPLTFLTACVVIFTPLGCGDGSLSPEQLPPPITILGAKLIDGSGAEPIDDAVIVIRGTRIETVGPRSHAPVPKGGDIIDGRGLVVIPGLIDLHCHYFGDRAAVERQLRAQLSFGVTSARSIGVDPPATLEVIADALSGKIPAPRVYTAGLGFTHPEGHPVDQTAVYRPVDEEEARGQVQQLAARGVDFVKMWVESRGGTTPKITAAIRAAIVQEAARHGIPPVAHISEQADVEQLAELGVTDFLHTVRDRETIGPSFVEMCKSRGLSFTPTLAIHHAAWYWAENPEQLDAPGIKEAFDPTTFEALSDAEAREALLKEPGLAEQKAGYARAEAFVLRMQREGIAIAAGSDGGAGNVAVGWGTHHEIELLAAAGLTPIEALTAATGSAAARLEGGNSERGLLKAGNVADLLVLGADPLDDIRNTRKIERIMKAGKWIR